MRVILACISLTLMILAFSFFTPAQAAAPAETMPMRETLKPDPVPARGSPAANPDAAMGMSHASGGATVHGSMGSMEGMQHGGMPGGMMGGMQHGGMVQGCMMKSMSAGSMMRGETYSDRAYLSAMIAHHEAAVDMADDALKNGKDPEVRKWAEAVKAAQEPEIKQMTGWLASMGGTDEAAANMMRQSMRAMMGNPMSQDADYNFVAMMIGHHAGAVDMAAGAIVGSKNDDVVRLSQNIVTSQLDEIIAYKGWLAKHRQP